MKKTNQPSPLERLQAEQRRLKTECRIKEDKLNKDFRYIHENATSILFSGLSYLFFGGKQKSDNTKATLIDNSNTKSIHIGISDYLSIGRSMLPSLWNIAKPMLITWGIRGAKNWLLNRFLRQKNKP